MRWGGIALLLFIVWHLLNFTIGKVNPQGGATDDPYDLLVDTFEVWWMTLIYLAAMLALALHLRHGVWSAAQTLGLTNNVRARRNANALGYGCRDPDRRRLLPGPDLRPRRRHRRSEVS